MAERLTFEQEQKIRERLAATTPGPWETEDDDQWTGAPYDVCYRAKTEGDPFRRFESLLDALLDGRDADWIGFKRWEDAEFTANAPADMAALFAELDAVRAERDRLRQVLTIIAGAKVDQPPEGIPVSVQTIARAVLAMIGEQAKEGQHDRR